VDQGLDRGDLLVRIRLHLLRVGLEVVALEEDGTLPFLADRRAEHDDRVFAGPLLGVADLAAGDLEEECADPEPLRGATRGASRVLGSIPWCGSRARSISTPGEASGERIGARKRTAPSTAARARTATATTTGWRCRSKDRSTRSRKWSST